MGKAKIVIIGGGPGGYETAAEASRHGLEVVLVSDSPLGGVCLHRGCIPTKCLCRSAEVLDDIREASSFGIDSPLAKPDMKAIVARKDSIVASLQQGVEFLLDKSGVEVVRGKASFIDAHTVSVRENPEAQPREIEADYIIIATGSVPAALPVEGSELEGVVTSDQLLSVDGIPDRLCVIGAGVIGLEMASVFRSFGSEVTVVEYAREVLPKFDMEIAKRLRQRLSIRGISFELSSAVSRIVRNEDGLEVYWVGKKGEKSCLADKVLIAVGRRPNLTSLNLSDLGIDYTAKGICTDSYMRTNVPCIFAIGDIRGGLMLAHSAVADGRVALASIMRDIGDSHELGEDGERSVIGDLSGRREEYDKEIPSAVFTNPEAAMIGLSEEECKAKSLSYRCCKAMYRANGKAMAMGKPEGICKIIVSSDESTSGLILGAHILGAHASDLIHEVAVVMNAGATIDTLRRTVHAHPTLSEIVHAAAEEY